MGRSRTEPCCTSVLRLLPGAEADELAGLPRSPIPFASASQLHAAAGEVCSVTCWYPRPQPTDDQPPPRCRRRQADHRRARALGLVVSRTARVAEVRRLASADAVPITRLRCPRQYPAIPSRTAGRLRSALRARSKSTSANAETFLQAVTSRVSICLAMRQRVVVRLGVRDRKAAPASISTYCSTDGRRPGTS
jgi:hypothetical protein